jgi:N-acetylneuraminate synthase
MNTLVIAEAGVNHNGSLERALEMIEVAADAGAAVVKFQTFRAEEVVSQNAPKAEYQRRTTDASESQLDMARKLELDADEHHALLRRCRERHIEFLSSPFDLPSVDLLTRSLKVNRLKIASGELTNFPLVLAAARAGTSLIVSTGMSTIGEVEEALGVIAFGATRSDEPTGNAAEFREAFGSAEGQRVLRERVSLLHCTTEYPADFADVNLRSMDTLASTFDLPVGLSDHTPGIAVAIAAVARGASIIEKHFTLDKALPGPDHTASLDPEELRSLIKSIKEVELSLGRGTKYPAAVEKQNLVIARRSLTASRRIAAGDTFTVNNLTTKRPGDGISASQYWTYLGRTAARAYDPDEMIDG